ncbi:hypothetical protein FSP39_020645 [Pinctada imbricata]|uniref:Protein SET n=1 Tax=Pinctada imbricata TaxID=66713 RepID=A0AA88YF40_PINIB|nr:hypothetical protein FSP39_020645 [Pinctada imbricata]
MATENGSPAKRPKLVGAEGDAPSEGDSIIQSALEEIDACQNEIDALNEKASEEILCVEQKYNKLRKPFYAKRNSHIKGIKNFWVTAFSNHPQLYNVLTDEDEECLQYLSEVEVEEFEDIKSGYRINFNFTDNPYFSDSVISKVFHLASTGVPTCTSTPVQWKDNMNLTKRKKNNRQGFFNWMQDTSDPAADEVAEVIKDDIWPNPLQYYLSNDSMENGVSDDENVDESVVVLDDDEDDDEVGEEEIYDVDDDDDEDDEIEASGEYETLDAVGDDDDEDDGAVHVLDDDEDEEGDDDDDVQEIIDEKENDEPDGDVANQEPDKENNGETAASNKEKSQNEGETGTSAGD